jgi:hypothetical protein
VEVNLKVVGSAACEAVNITVGCGLAVLLLI